MEIITDKSKWNQSFNVDVFFSYEYFELYSRNYGVEFEGILFDNGAFLTHIIRDNDVTTPYGYGGPINLTKASFLFSISLSVRRSLYCFHCLS